MGSPRAHFLLLAATLLLGSAARGEARFIPLGDLAGGDFYSQGFAVTPEGSPLVATGGSFSAAGQEVFRWSEAGGLENLGDLPGGAVDGDARGIDGDGSRIVGFSEGASGVEGFLWTEGVGMVGLGDLPGGAFASSAWAITPDGSLIVGDAANADGTVAVRWTAAGGYEVLGDLPGGATAGHAYAVTPDGDTVVGAGTTSSGLEAFRWTPADGMQGLGWVGGVGGSRAKSVSPDGRVVVGFSSAPGGYEAFRWTEEVGMESLGDLPGGNVFSQANGVSASGDVIVGISATGNPSVPFTFEAALWTPRDGMRRLKDVLEVDYGLDLTGWTPWELLDISPDGHRLVGIAYNPQGKREAFVVELPVTACHDGVDNDGDGGADLDDPACRNLADDTESDACQNGLDDDGDGQVDFDGGASIHGSVVADPDLRCTNPWRRSEARHCGLGFELTMPLVAMLAWRGRRVRRVRRDGEAWPGLAAKDRPLERGGSAAGRSRRGRYGAARSRADA